MRPGDLSRRRLLRRLGAGSVGAAVCAGCLGRDRSADRPTETEPPTSERDERRTTDETAERRTTEASDRATADSTRARTDPLTDVDPRSLPSPLSAGTDNPFVYVNDIPLDNFNGELALGMASDADGIDLRGYVNEFPRPAWWDSDRKYRRLRDRYETHHRRTHAKAADSGLTGLPEPTFGLDRRHRKPDSGVVADTAPVGSPGTDLIVRAARDASPERPLVVACGGPLCTVADALLTDPSIADSVVVSWRARVNEAKWNEMLSGWSAMVVARNLRLVVCLAQGAPKLTRDRIERELPATPLKEYMLTKTYEATGENPLNGGPKWEGDAISILSPAHPSTRRETGTLRVDGFLEHWKIKNEIPSLVPTDAESHIKVVLASRHPPITEAWYSHMADESTWDRR